MELGRLNSGLEVLDRDQCLKLLATQTVGRLGIVVDGRPEIHPVNFALVGEHVVIRTGQGTKLTAALGGPVVFEVDSFDEDNRTGWSVMMHGTANLTGSRTGRSNSPNRVEHPWREAELPLLLRIVANKVTGRRLAIAGGHRWPPAGSGPLEVTPES
jgi:nitroimidazol reductase NimA-like FMN-containing flavoprotein (pyridoxamine 5'-phosphate oxidase superfamily)